jgi:TetR/AcrR family transcriptional regulator, fatty acid metabolism regulator protein
VTPSAVHIVDFKMNHIHYSVNWRRPQLFSDPFMPRITAERMRDRRDSIVNAARKVFSDKGYDSASISEIARQANSSDGLIYRYFDGKRDLLFAALDDFYAEVLQEGERAIKDAKGFEAKLEGLLRSHIGVFAEDAGMCRLFISEVRNLDEYVGSNFQALNKRYTKLLSAVLDLGAAEGVLPAGADRRVVRDMIFGGIEHIAWRHLSAGQKIDVQALSKQVAVIILKGITAL